MSDGIKDALHHQKEYGGKIGTVNEKKFEEYGAWRELGGNWTIETDEDAKDFFYIKTVMNLTQNLITQLKMVKLTTVKLMP